MESSILPDSLVPLPSPAPLPGPIPQSIAPSSTPVVAQPPGAMDSIAVRKSVLSPSTISAVVLELLPHSGEGAGVREEVARDAISFGLLEGQYIVSNPLHAISYNRANACQNLPECLTCHAAMYQIPGK